MARKTPLPELVVEGKDDKHVIWALCERHNVPETFIVVTPNNETHGIEAVADGIEALLDGLPVRLKTPGLKTLGVVVDADQAPQSRWEAICERFARSGYANLPSQPEPQGMVIEQPPLPRVGIWLMPNNQDWGMLEDFVAYLIPDGDPLRPKAQAIIADIERDGLHRYTLPHHHPKALIHTWLAWQERPGQPMGQAITARALLHDAPLARTFVEWLLRLFTAV